MNSGRHDCARHAMRLPAALLALVAFALAPPFASAKFSTPSTLSTSSTPSTERSGSTPATTFQPFNFSTSSYVWGLDIDGTLQVAGGVGGLLAVIRDDGVYLPCYDANGNITEYVSTNGEIVAHYDYSPFGELIFCDGFYMGITTGAAVAPLLFLFNISRIVVAIRANSMGISWAICHDMPYLIFWIATVSICACRIFRALRHGWKPQNEPIIFRIASRDFWFCLFVLVCLSVNCGCRKLADSTYTHKIISIDTDKNGSNDFITVDTYKDDRLLMSQSTDELGHTTVVLYNGDRSPMFAQVDLDCDGKPDEMAVWQGRSVKIFTINCSDDIPQYSKKPGVTNLIWNVVGCD